jgi:hypothetical protein
MTINHKHADAEIFTVREDCGGEQDSFSSWSTRRSRRLSRRCLTAFSPYSADRLTRCLQASTWFHCWRVAATVTSMAEATVTTV